jgi:hypothetical protein
VEIFADPDTARLVKVVLPVTDKVFAIEAEPFALISSNPIASRTMLPETVKSPPIVTLPVNVV